MMNQYHYIAEEDYDKEFSINEYSCLKYYSKKAMKQRYPKGGFAVLGGIGCDTKEAKATFVYNEEEISYYPLQKNRFCYGVIGYVSLDHNQYIAIVKRTLIRNSILSISSILLSVALVFLVIQLLPESGIDKNAKDYTPPEGMNIKTDPNHIALPGYDLIQMNANSDTAYIALWNPPDNPCYFKFVIQLEDSEKVLYESDLIPPGKAVTSIKMSQKFPQGEYKIKINVLTYSLDDKEKAMNGGVINATIVAMK